MDREKVLRGLECCIKSTWDDPFAECEHCPYNEISIYVQECRAVLSADALTLLKEQEAVEPVLEQGSMVCGNCGHEVIWQRLFGDNVWADEQLDYCPKCGRAVKWDDT